jgi:hypothetical protein
MMTTTILDRVPVEHITEQARQAHPGRAVAVVLATVLLRTGWLLARSLSAFWLGAAWCAIAVREGWREGRSPEWAAHVARKQEARRVPAGHPGSR